MTLLFHCVNIVQNSVLSIFCKRQGCAMHCHAFRNLDALPVTVAATDVATTFPGSAGRNEWNVSARDMRHVFIVNVFHHRQ